MPKQHNNPGGDEAPSVALTWKQPLLFDARDVAKKCRCNRHRALELMHEAGAVRLGRSVRVRPADLDALLARMAKGGGINN